MVSREPLSGGNNPMAGRPTTGSGPTSSGPSGHPDSGSTMGRPGGQPGGNKPKRTGPASDSGSGMSRSGSTDSTDPGDLVQTTLSEAQTVAGQVVDQAKQQAEVHLGSQFSQVADHLGEVKNVFEEVSQKLHERDQTWLAPLADQATTQVDRLSGYFRGKDVGEIAGDLEHLARRQPALFFGGAFAVGLLAARFLRSSRAASSDDSSRALAPRSSMPTGPWMGNRPTEQMGTGTTMPGYTRSAGLPASAVETAHDSPRRPMAGGMGPTGGTADPSRTTSHPEPSGLAGGAGIGTWTANPDSPGDPQTGPKPIDPGTRF